MNSAPQGVAHAFKKVDGGKLADDFVIEPLTAASVEAMNNGARTCYTAATATTFGAIKAQDVQTLPAAFQNARFADDWSYRAACAARSWTRPHAQQAIVGLIPSGGEVRTDFNFSVESKRVLNDHHEVSDADNIKQDASIDVYGRNKVPESPTGGGKP